MRVLFLSAWFPWPPDNGSKLRIYHLIQGLAERHEVTLITFTRDSDGEPDAGPLRQMCRQVIIIPWKQYRPNSWKARAAFLSIKPRSIVDKHSPAMAKEIRQALAEEHYDAVVASQLDIAAYAEHFGRTPALFEEVEVGYLYEQFSKAQSAIDYARYGLTWIKHRHFLSQLLKRFYACTVVSETERQLLQRQVNDDAADIKIVPNCVELSEYENVSEQKRQYNIIFTGSFTYQPNYEAMQWFVNEVYPRIQAQVPDASLTITGNHANRPFPTHRNVTLTGFVEDIRPLVASATVSVAPIWTGGGTRLKILEAMALRTPVVSTSKGTEGLEVRDNEHLLIADTAQAFSDSVLRLLSDESLRATLANNAHKLVAEKYNWPQVMCSFVELVEDVASRGERQRIEA